MISLLLHPVRLRLTYVLSDGRARTTTELSAALPDVPKTSVYRHVGLLADGGVLEVADEQRVRGAVERHYRLRRERTAIDPDAGASMSLEDHRHGFAAAAAALLAEFNGYLERAGADPFADSVSYRQGICWLNAEELEELIAELRTVLAARWGKPATPDRRPHLMSLIMFPTERPPGDETE